MKAKVEAVGSTKKFLALWRHISPKCTALVSHSEPPTLHPCSDSPYHHNTGCNCPPLWSRRWNVVTDVSEKLAECYFEW